MSLPPPTMYPSLARYARSMHAPEGGGHHVASPLGAWLLLALCAPAADPTTRRRLAEVLGMDVSEASVLAASLLAEPHPLVLSAAGAWLRLPPGHPRPEGWLAGLPPAVTVAPLVDQGQLDAWADQATQGLIQRFPITMTPETVLVLATALATRVSWRVPFDLVPATELGPGSDWAGQVDQVLRAPAAHETFVCSTPAAGEVVAHRAEATGGLMVLSVMARPGVPAVEVLSAAHDLAHAVARDLPVARRGLFDLPLGDTPLWSLTEEAGWTTAPSGREERYTTVLPAWSARSDLDLDRPELGFPLAAPALARAAGLPPKGYQARQATVARYSRTGFEAAAVSAIGMVMGCPQSRSGAIRRATVRFGHPFAVVAVAVTPPGAPSGAWHGLPVFSAWVAEVEEARDH